MNSESTHVAFGPVQSGVNLLSTGAISVHVGDDLGLSCPSGGFIVYTESAENCRRIAAAFSEAERMLREAAALKEAL
jgi:hypothetical protein